MSQDKKNTPFGEHTSINMKSESTLVLEVGIVHSSSVAPSDQNPLGGTNLIELNKMADENFGKDSELDSPEIGIALQAIAKGLGLRIRHQDYCHDEKRLCIFLITDRPRYFALQHNGKKEPIVNNGSVQLNGKLWISGPAFQSAYKCKLEKSNNSDIFQEIEDLGLGTAAAFVFDPNGTDLELRYYPDGMSAVDSVQSFLIAEQSFSLESLDKILTRFHETSIRTPDSKLGDDGPWIDGKKYIPRKNTEAFLQNWLKIALNSYFQDPYVCEFEKPGNEGRCDLMLVSKHPTLANSFTHHAVLELKVLRSRTSGDSSVSQTVSSNAIVKGLDQAIAYKSEQSAENAMLCCFDMRNDTHCDNDNCFAPISNRAAENEIELRRYRLYGSSDDFRSEEYA